MHSHAQLPGSQTITRNCGTELGFDSALDGFALALWVEQVRQTIAVSTVDSV